MINIKFRAERSGRSQMNIVFNHHTAFGWDQLPLASFDASDGDGLSSRIESAHVLHINGEVAHLVERVPHRYVEC